MATTSEPNHLSEAIVAFSLEGKFPDDIASFLPVSQTNLGPTIEALDKAKAQLESEIHTINEETRDEVSSWEKNAKSLQDDIIRSKAIANDIIRQSEAPETSGEAIQEAEEKTEFLNREVQYSQQLVGVLKGIRHVNQMLDQVEQASKERRVLDSLMLLENSWAAIDELGASKTCRVMKTLDLRTFELKSEVHAVFDRIWKQLIQVDVGAGQVAIFSSVKDEMTLTDAVVGLKAYKEVEERMEQLWRNIDAAIISPRMVSKAASLPSIKVSEDAIELDGQADGSIASLLADLEATLALIANKLPAEILESFCRFMMGELIPRLINDWLSPAVPTSLTNMKAFEEMIENSRHFCTALSAHGFSGLWDLQAWVEDAPQIWLQKCRETALATIRTRLANGIGESRQVEKVEKQMVSKAEGQEIKASGAGATAENDGWGEEWGVDDGWDDHEEAGPEASTPANNESKRLSTAVADDDDMADAWDAWGDDGGDDDAPKTSTNDKKEPESTNVDEDEDAEAWGWGDEDTTEQAASKPSPKKSKPQRSQEPEETREFVMKETYHISSMPEPVLELISAIFEDGANLARGKSEHGPVAAMAPGLFNLPTSVLALFRAISPHYYALDGGGTMFLYNDATYLAEQLADFAAHWSTRSDLTTQAKELLKLDDDIKALRSFANRSYSHEIAVQKTVLRDLIGGSQALAGQDEWESAIEAGTHRIRDMASTWERILMRSVWLQAVGSLTESLATKLITDVLEMSDIGASDSYSIAKAISTATELDDLFLPSRLFGTPSSAEEVPTTAEFAPSWLRLKFLSEVLQSNLKDVRFLWLESDLSLYFTLNEVVDLIEASFEANPQRRETIREIQSHPSPRA
ncbi:uncharacterized protein F5Z01DRAFT_378227 [Emericellopsis atlantica]|uniref:ZW10 C-terminal helical domain-containing protein n=1 Tax=Emericellopsis atlantica TaxID=2614577 RepID=A0A9P8CM35_9HYPO|nr:uncharacterized protein F5Z01DRAFT_378227 [Emericellopsis atlantica]KAG9250246.1 hypothetical protein F5Z01DRAFT_378227 [Emericellopsis atlantica]